MPPRVLLGLLLLPGACRAPQATDEELSLHVRCLEQVGVEPVDFVLERLREHDLLLFDDGLHSAVEPFEFYAELVRTEDFRRAVDVLLLEVVAENQQEHLDAFLASGNPSDLLPAFRNDVSGTGGVGYRTYLELLTSVREENLRSPPEEHIAVVAVSNAVDWGKIRTTQDLAAFQASLTGRDEFMYGRILAALDGFHSGKKGVFLTNTRHAYARLRTASGELFGDTGILFHARHPGKVCSLRIHNVQLAIERELEPAGPVSAEGLERVAYRWTRVDAGIWDDAFAAHGDEPVALLLEGTPFGAAPYLGNHQLDAAPGQTMVDAYDALVFLAPLERLRQSASMPGLHAPEFQPELARRVALLLDEKTRDSAIAEHGSLAAYTAANYAGWPESPAPSVE